MKSTGFLYRISFKPAGNFFLTGNNPLLLFKELQEIGFCSISAHTGLVPELAAIDPEASYFSWEILLATDREVDTVRDVFVFVEDISEIHIATLMEKIDPAGISGYKRLGEILVERGHLRPEDLVEALARQKPLGELLVDASLVSRSQVESALAEQRVRKQRLDAALSKGSIRVPFGKLDQLIKLVGELVTIQARLTQVSSTRAATTEFREQVRQVEQLTSELRDCVLDIRMLPIGDLFGKFGRLVRDLSTQQQKEVELITRGGGTELDKNIIEKLREPLVHLISCCLDFGLETPAEREAAGKPRCGCIRLTAVHSGANAIISVQDDGRGMDLEKIRTRALAMGLIKSRDELSDREMQNLIFTSGFGVAGQRSEVSGRSSAGMDVVRTAVEILKGSVEVASQPGKGTIFTITLPPSLDIIDGLLVRSGDIHFVLPLGAVEEIVEITEMEREQFRGRRISMVRERLVPYVRLRDFFRLGGGRPEREKMVVVGINNQSFGLMLDNVVGGHQTVIKPLGAMYREIDGLCGSTILGSGEVALIIDVPRLVHQARMEEVQLFSPVRHSQSIR